MSEPASRFPFPSFPRGWYVVGLSPSIGRGEVQTLHYFDQDIVLFRTESGELAVVDKVCPHLGAHLGGGRVDGECLRCPFHGWGFDPAGHCVDVPYAPKIPPRASLRRWPMREQNGLIFVYYDASGAAPTWELPALEEDGWTPNRTIRWEVETHPQEVAENTVDSAHLGPVHQVDACSVHSVEQQGHVMRVVLRMVANGAVIQMPDEINDVELDVTLHGLGQIISNTHVLTAGLRTRQRIHPTPIDAGRVAIFAAGNTRQMPDPEYTREIDEIFWNAFVADFEKDFPIWENKVYLERPLLASGDGPIGRYRRWARQFYGDAASGARLVSGGAEEANGAAAQRGRRALRWLGTQAQQARAAIGEALVARSSGGGASTPEGTPADATLQVGTAPGAAGAVPARDEPAPAQSQFASVDAYFDELETRFDPAAAKDLDAVYQWVLTGSTPCSHFAEIREGQIRVAQGTHAAPTVTIEMGSDDYLRMINGELNGALAFSTGVGKLRGPVRLAMKMKSLFPLEPPPSS